MSATIFLLIFGACRMATQNVTQMTGVRLKNGRCTSDEYEVALVVSMCNISGVPDIHWYRKDEDNTWSHKRGWSVVVTGVFEPLADLVNEDYIECNRFCVKKARNRFRCILSVNVMNISHR